MNLKTLLRLSLDAVVLLTLVLMYNKRAVNLAYHEIAGLFLFGLLIVHLVSHRQWITAITSKIASGTIPAKTAVSYAVSAAAFVSFVAVAVSGIAISRVVFDMQNALPVWKTVHKTFAACALVLIGVHVGLHHTFILGLLRKRFPLPEKTRSLLMKAFIVVVLVGGTVGFATTPFFHWLSLPFISRPVPGKTAVRADALPVSAEQTGKNRAPESRPTGRPPSDAAPTQPAQPAGRVIPDANRDTPHRPNGPRQRAPSGVSAVLKTLGQFLGMTLFISVVTAFIDTVVSGKRKKRGPLSR